MSSSPANSPILRRIPPLSYALQNILLSTATILGASASLGITVFVVVPLSIVRMVLLLARDAYIYTQRKQNQDHLLADKSKKRKIVLVVGATHGIGLSIVQQYANVATTDGGSVSIIAVGPSNDKLAQLKGAFDGYMASSSTNITLHTECFDVGRDPKVIIESVSDWDRKYGPITHLYAASGLSSDPDKRTWELNETLDVVQNDVVGLVALVLATYERMKHRREGKICIVGSTSGVFAPANMIGHASSKAFLNTFGASFRALAYSSTSPPNTNGTYSTNANTKSTPDGIEVTTIYSSYIGLRIADGSRQNMAGRQARKVVQAVERGGEGICVPATMEGLLIYGLKGLNPICDEAARWASWVVGVAAEKYVLGG